MSNTTWRIGQPVLVKAGTVNRGGKYTEPFKIPKDVHGTLLWLPFMSSGSLAIEYEVDVMHRDGTTSKGKIWSHFERSGCQPEDER